MPNFIVRTNCEYSIEVEADNENEAMSKADKIDVATWTQAWAPYEVEED